MSNTYNLQLRHGSESKNFSTRDEVIAYINGQLQYGGVSLLPYEIILFYYGEDDDKKTIIMVGLPEGKTYNGQSYFLVDTADLSKSISDVADKTENVIEALNKEKEDRIAADEEIKKEVEDYIQETEGKESEVEKDLALTKDDLESVIKACGLIYNEKLSDDRVSYEADTHDEIIRDAGNITEAIDKISKFVAKISSELQIAVSNTDTVNLTVIEDEKNGGNIISADVNIAGTDGLSKKTFDNNIIGKTSDGIYAAASLEQSTANANVLVFKTSGYVDGQFKVDAFETEVPLAVYSGDNGKKTGINVNVNTDTNVISAELALSTDEDNILKLVDGEYIVDGRAKNIKYKDTTVAGALISQANRLTELESNIETIKNIEINGLETNTISLTTTKAIKGDVTIGGNVKLSNDNSIVVANGGLSANISASYTPSNTTLLIKVGTNSYSIDLSDLAVSVLDSAAYDSTTEEIVLTFIVGEGSKTLRIPVGTLIHDIEVEDSNTIDLTLTSISGGPNRIKGELIVDKSKTDNILTVSSNGAYVSKSYITDAVAEETKSRVAVDEKIENSIDDINKAVSENTTAIKANEVAITQALNDAKTYTYTYVTTLSASITEEKNRAEKAEAENANNISTNKTNIEVNAEAIKTENERAIAAENKVLSDANAYTDHSVEDVTKAYINADVQNLSEAKYYADEKDNEILAETKQYVQDASDEFQTKIDTLNETISKQSLSSIETNTVKTNIDKQDNGIVVSSDVKLDAEKANIIKLSGNGLYAEVSMSYDKSTNTISFNNGNGERTFELSAHSILNNGYYDSTTEEIVLVTIVNDETKEIRIPAKDLVHDVDVLNTENNPIQLKKTIDDIKGGDLISASVNISTAVSNGLVNNNGTLYVSKDANDHTAIYGTENTTVQLAINALKEGVDDIKTNVSEIQTELSTKLSVSDAEKKYANIVDFTVVKDTYAKSVDVEAIESRVATNEGNITTLQNSVNDLIINVDKKANASDVYTKAEIIAEYAKTVDMQSQLSDKLNSDEAKLTYATKEDLQTVKDEYATIKYVDNITEKIDNKVDANTVSIDNFNLTYNPATSELTYTDKKGEKTVYNLYSGSLIKGGKFDELTNSIVLTIENAGQESDITIPVSQLLSDVTDRIQLNADNIVTINEAIAKLANDFDVKDSSTVTLVKNTIGDKDTIEANVRISSSNKQAIQTSGDGLYVSNDLEDYTVVYGALGTISAQTAISKLKEAVENSSTGGSDARIEELNERVTQLETIVSGYNDKITALQNSIDDINTLLQSVVDGGKF